MTAPTFALPADGCYILTCTGLSLSRQTVGLRLSVDDGATYETAGYTINNVPSSCLDLAHEAEGLFSGQIVLYVSNQRTRVGSMGGPSLIATTVGTSPGETHILNGTARPSFFAAPEGAGPITTVCVVGGDSSGVFSLTTV
jgi:hypothetical protein